MSEPKGKLVIIGGSVDKGTLPEGATEISKNTRFFERGILQRIVMESARQQASRVEIITTASVIPEEIGESYIQAFSHLGVKDLGVLSIRTRREANNPDNLERLKNADVVIMTGGDQLKLSSVLGGTFFHSLMLDKYQNENFIVSGTSAGAAASSNNMIYQGSSHEALLKGEVKITGGLGFINNVIIDTHFVQRGRIGRLFYACASNPVNLGIGLGEDTGLLIRNGHEMEAIGSGLVILVDATQMEDTNLTDIEMGEPVSIEHLVVHVMSLGDHFNLRKRKLDLHRVKLLPGPDSE